MCVRACMCLCVVLGSVFMVECIIPRVIELYVNGFVMSCLYNVVILTLIREVELICTRT